MRYLPIAVTARSNAWVCGRWLAGIAGSNPRRGKDVFVSIVCYQVQRSPTECGVSECDREASKNEEA
jgi:hypothetical protein